MRQKLTTKQYWESYYNKDHADKEHINSVCSYYDVFWNMLIDENSSEKSIIEIGGFPGRYLAYLALKYDLQPTCLDYNSDTSQIDATFKIMKVKNYHILQRDFTKYVPENQYDYLISNGFIEHFKNFDEILDLHTQYLKPEGKMLIMIPNMKGYIRFYKYLVDYKNLKVHNIRCMSLDVFKQFAKRNNLRIIYLDYHGGFPYNVHQKLDIIRKFIYKGHWFIFKKWLNKKLIKKPSPYFSSSIIAIFEKN